MTTRDAATTVGHCIPLACIRQALKLNSTAAFSLESAYPGLDKHLDRIGVHCPKCVSLSPDGYYFMRSSWGTASSLPVALETDADGDAELEDVWFGKDDSYVAQNARGGWRWDLRGHYGSLGQTLKYGTKGIGSVGLNVTDGSFYIVLGMTELFSSIRAVAD